jgi:hypothetical protein
MTGSPFALGWSLRRLEEGRQAARLNLKSFIEALKDQAGNHRWTAKLL